MWRGGGKQKIYTLWCSYIFIVHKRKYFNAFLWRYSAPIWLACVSKVGLCYLESCGFGYFLGNLDERNCQTFEEKENYWEIYVSKKILLFLWIDLRSSKISLYHQIFLVGRMSFILDFVFELGSSYSARGFLVLMDVYLFPFCHIIL